MYAVSSLVAHPQPAELLQLGWGSLDYPPVDAQPAAKPGTLPGNHWSDTSQCRRR